MLASRFVGHTTARARAVVVLLALLFAPVALVSSQPAVGVSSPALQYSVARDRSLPAPLDGVTLGGPVYVFLDRADDGDVVSAQFSVDGEAIRTEAVEPFDLNGSATTWPFPARAWDATDLPRGFHQVEARIELRDGSVQVESARISVGASEGLMYSLAPDRGAPRPLDGSQPTAPVYAFVAPDSEVRIAEFFVDGDPVRTEAVAPFDLAGSEPTWPFAARPFDLAELGEGQHRIAARLTDPRGDVTVLSAGVGAPSGPPVDPPPPPPSSSTSSTTTTTRPPVVPPPVSGDWPDASNTGPSGSLAASGSLTVTTPGAVIEDLKVTGTITVRAANVTIRNVEVNCNGARYGITSIPEQHPGLVVEDSYVHDCSGIGISGYAGFTVRRTEVSRSRDGIVFHGNNLVEDSWVHDPVNYTGEDHNDATQASSGSNITIRRNSLDGPYREQTAAIIIKNTFGPVNNVLIEDNKLSGGTYSLYVRSGGDPQGNPSNVVIRDNTWVRGTWKFGTHSIDKGAGFQASGNRYDDGTPLTI